CDKSCRGDVWLFWSDSARHSCLYRWGDGDNVGCFGGGLGSCFLWRFHCVCPQPFAWFAAAGGPNRPVDDGNTVFAACFAAVGTAVDTARTGTAIHISHVSPGCVRHSACL